MTQRTSVLLLAAPVVLHLSGCIRAQNYHPGTNPMNKSTFHRHFNANDPSYGPYYFQTSDADEAYIEFNARGSMYRDKDSHPVQLEAALDLIKSVRFPSGSLAPRKIAVYIFVHGWKNNASESSNNVQGFRRFLSHIAAQHCEPVIGVYIGWPGASLANDAFLSFWNREPAADNVGNGELTDALRSLLQAVKGLDYNDPDDSVAVVIGHSFGGIVLERAAPRLIEEQLNSPRNSAAAPADLFVLINEAGAAAIARPFLYDLINHHVTYTASGLPNTRQYPLLLSMTSVGDIATKFAYPGGELISINRSKPLAFSGPDKFGQKESKPYDLLTAAHMIALLNQEIVRQPTPRCDLSIPVGTQTYCLNALPNPLNPTPYWILSLPQVFVPDHSSVFQDAFLQLIDAVVGMRGAQLTCPTALGLAAPPPSPATLGAVPPAPPPIPPAPVAASGRPRMQRTN